MTTCGLQPLIDALLRAVPGIRFEGGFPKAVLWDTYASHGQFLTDQELAVRVGKGSNAFLQALAGAIVPSIACRDPRRCLDRLFLETLPELARLSRPDRWSGDPEGSEELVRIVLRDLETLPEGESPEVASRRLQAVSLLERRRLLEVSRQAEQRAREVREALAAQAAREAADKYSRE